MISAIALRTVGTFDRIDAVWLISNGGEPNGQTHLLESCIYTAAVAKCRFGWAAALAMVIFAVLFLVTQVVLDRTKATAQMS